ncbi:cingulin-like protein 1 [Cynara cardunculus var. scolymus]|nr:cingulin-like protein 1 [Cynara cardunculus var. scolymus]
MDDMEDSLFEGMVLFDPSSSSSQLPVKSALDDNNKHDDSIQLRNHGEISQQPPQSPTPAAITTTGASFEPLDENLFSDLTLFQPQSQDDVSSTLDHPPLSPSSSSSSRSTTDVATTFASPSQTSATITSTSVSNSRGAAPLARSLSSQNSSTRKKKRAGIRIGYGRTTQTQDANVDVDDMQPQLRLPSHSTTTSPSPSPSLSSASSLPVVIAEEKDEPGEQKQQIIPDSEISSDLTAAATSTAEEQIKINEVIPNSESVELTPKNIPQEEEEEEKEKKQVQSRENSMESRYDQIKAQIADKLNCAQQAVASVSAKRKDFIRKRRKAEEELNLASAKHKEMEKELEEAVESEDFETAERVSDSLAAAEKNKELLSIALRDAESNCDAIDAKMQEALELQIVAEEECAALLESFAMDADHDADAVISNAKSKTSEELEKWLSLSEALEVKKMEVEIESHVLSGACLMLDDSIEHAVKDDREESELLHKKKNMLAEELQELLALVKQKEAVIAENDSKIEKVEKRMADVVSSFQEAQSNIHSKSDNLQLGLSQLQLDSDALSRKKEEIDDYFLQEEARGSKVRELGRISAAEAGMYQEVVNLRRSLVQFISKSWEDKARLARTEQKLFDDVQMLRQDISAVRASLQDLSSTKSGTQQAIESSKQRLLFIEKRVPELESEKRVAATARNFKEAARIANEAKTLYVEKESLQTKIDEVVSELKKIEDDINHNVNRLQEKEENISSMEKELEMVRYQRLLLLAGTATAERSAAIELGDLQEADILLKEAEAADSEARKIQPTSKVEEEEFDTVPKSFISMELVATLDRNQLAELAASTQMAEP